MHVALSELLEKARDGDFLRTIAEAKLHLGKPEGRNDTPFWCCRISTKDRVIKPPNSRSRKSTLASILLLIEAELLRCLLVGREEAEISVRQIVVGLLGVQLHP